MVIGMGAEEERAMTTTIASAKATDMATVTEMKREQGQWQREMERYSDFPRVGIGRHMDFTQKIIVFSMF
jgi:hypothetical protein